ncbi:MAG TPA: phosphomannomutase/phosphoglucomutase, partial [Candidatus Krumholzibacterium sp.]|nr:phosphomannomutase/phosphoglucomutase [Candidatus Krumholzibacterium sp.]
MDIPKKIFREYDIRGLVDEDLTDEGVRRLGLAMAFAFEREEIGRVVVGRDIRHSSERYFDRLSEGLTEGGIDVIDIGVVPTPVFYFAARTWDIKGGVMITASHNPAEFNGFKVLRGQGTIYGSDIMELHTLATGAELPAPGGGKTTSRDVKEEYASYLASNIHLKRPVRFAVDGGNGTAGISAPDIFGRLGCEPVELFMEPDGDFPNHHPDPTVEKNLAALKEAVISGGLEL